MILVLVAHLLLLGVPAVDGGVRPREDHAFVVLCDSKPVTIPAILRDYQARMKPRISLASETTAPSLVEFTSDHLAGSVRAVSHSLASEQLAPAIRASWQWRNAGVVLRSQAAYL